MKILIVGFVSCVLLLSCSEEDNPVTPLKGSIFIGSSPAGAEIWLNGLNTSTVTPNTLTELIPGSYALTLKLQNYLDTTFVVSVIGGQITPVNVVLTHITNTGNIFISSNPAGAEIWLDGTNTYKVTPDTVKDLDAGVYSVTLKLTDYNDTTFSISVTENQTSVVGPIVLTSNINTTFFGGAPIRIYESFGTTASQPNGLDLSTGIAYGISSPEANLIDIYYYSDAAGTTFLVQSADNHSGLIRRTDFFVGSSTDIFDGVDSPLRGTGTWTDNMNDTENNYVFLYDHDGHYSKLKILNMGGGSGPGDPAWLDVQWYYNNTILDSRFQ